MAILRHTKYPKAKPSTNQRLRYWQKFPLDCSFLLYTLHQEWLSFRSNLSEKWIDIPPRRKYQLRDKKWHFMCLVQESVDLFKRQCVSLTYTWSLWHVSCQVLITESLLFACCNVANNLFLFSLWLWILIVALLISQGPIRSCFCCANGYGN